MTRTAIASLCVSLSLLGALILGACGSGQKGPASPSSSSSAAPSMSFNPSAGMTPIDVNIPAGACTVSVTSALGSGYRASEDNRPKIGEALRGAFSPCLQKSPNAKGTTHLSGQVDASGRVSSVLPSPGGAMPSELAKCLTDAMGRTTLPPPLDGASPLLVFVVNNCP